MVRRADAKAMLGDESGWRKVTDEELAMKSSNGGAVWVRSFGCTLGSARLLVTTYTASGTVIATIEWADEMGNPGYIVDLIGTVTRVAVETVRIVQTDTYIEKDSSINEDVERLRHSATVSPFTRKVPRVKPTSLRSY